MSSYDRKTAMIGNTYGIGNSGPVTRNPLTQVLLSQLAEINRETSQEVKHDIAAMLIKLALGGTFKFKELRKDKRGVMRMLWTEKWFPPDIVAIKEIFDRTQGKAPQQVNVDATHKHEVESGSALERLTRLIASEDAKLVEGESTEVVE